MDGHTFHLILVTIQHTISFLGVLVILSGVLYSLFLYIRLHIYNRHPEKHGSEVNIIRLTLGRRIILGLEFIVAADLIGTTSAPDYYTVGILGLIVLIRTVLSFSLNKELISISNENNQSCD